MLNPPDLPNEDSASHSEPSISRGLISTSRFLSEDQYRSFIENLPVLFYAVDPTPPYSPIYVSPACSKFGYPMTDWMSDAEMWVRVIHPEDREWVFEQTTVSTETGEEVEYEYRVVDANGKVHWVHDRGCLIRNDKGNVVCREGVIIDITDRKRAEEEIRLGQERFRNIFENASDIIYIHDLEGTYISINDAGERIFGYTRDETLRMNMRDVAVPDQLEVIRQQLSAKLRAM
jgi:PAS domain S-box-containing protein